ncbi:hypothetical protein CLAIMM_14639 [Cladophialophora immunda]|nr:hypothetical protein CLAIMM_14639 [Cladophialophora immunda]
MAHLVKKGDTICIPSESLGGANGEKATVHWSQAVMSRTEVYWLCKYTVESGSAAEGQIYVQASKLEEFRQKKNDGKDFTFVVDGSFQYGQDKAMTTRFPFYHDKTNKAIPSR